MFKCLSGSGSRVILIDARGLGSAPRSAFMFDCRECMQWFGCCFTLLFCSQLSLHGA